MQPHLQRKCEIPWHLTIFPRFNKMSTRFPSSQNRQDIQEHILRIPSWLPHLDARPLPVGRWWSGQRHLETSEKRQWIVRSMVPWRRVNKRQPPWFHEWFIYIYICLYGKNFAKMEFLLGRMSRWFECLLILVCFFVFNKTWTWFLANPRRLFSKVTEMDRMLGICWGQKFGSVACLGILMGFDGSYKMFQDLNGFRFV